MSSVYNNFFYTPPSTLGPQIEIITSRDPLRRGNQLSLHLSNCSIAGINDYLSTHGAVVGTQYDACLVFKARVLLTVV